MASKYMIENYDYRNGYSSPLNIRRTNPLPLDNDFIKLSYEDAVNYAKNDPAAYVGQFITVLSNDISGNENVTLYQIISESGNLREIKSNEELNMNEISEDEIDSLIFSVFGN